MSIAEDNTLKSLHPTEFKAAEDVIKSQHKEESTPSSSEVTSSKNQRKIGEKLVVLFSKEIGQGIDGTVVYEGTYDGRPVAVKRILQSHATLIAPEIKNLVASDHGPNIVRYHGNENDRNFIYLALERCDCNLDDLIRLYSTYSNQNESISIHLEKLKNVLGDVKLWEGNIDRPSPLLLKLMSDIVSGLFALHKLNIVHRDLKPQNILIIKESSTLCAKLSDMGISKQLSAEDSD